MSDIRPRHLLALPYLPVILAPFVLMSPVMFTGRALFWGVPVFQFVPWWNFAWETLRSGHFPLWNPLVGMGAPLIANYQSALFYPPNWLYLMLAAFGGTPAIAWGQALLVALHLAWAGLGMMILARRLGLGYLAQTVSGLAFGLSAYLVARAGFLSINSAAAWLPWIMAATFDVATVQNQVRFSTYFRPVCWLAVLIALQLLAGHAQITWYTLLLAGLWTGFLGWHGEGTKSILRSWLLFGLALLIAFALTAVQILPTAEYLFQSQRSGVVDYELAMTYSFWPWRLLGLLVPGMFGNPAWGDFWGYANYWEDAVYIGMLPLLLAIATLFRKDSMQRVKYFLVALLPLSFLLAMGKNTPIYPWLYQHVPTFGLFQAPTRWTIWTVFALALLAGLGAQGWRTPKGRLLYWVRLGTAGAFAVTLGALAGWYLLQNNTDVSRLVTMVRATAAAGTWAFGAGVLALCLPEEEQQPEASLPVHTGFWFWAVAAWVSLDLLVAGWGLNPGIPLDFYRSKPDSPWYRTVTQVKAMLDDGRLFLSSEDDENLRFKKYFRFITFQPASDWSNLRAALLPNINMLDNVPSVNNSDPLLPGRYARWMATLEDNDPMTREYMFHLMGVSVKENVDVGAPLGVRYEPTGIQSRFHWSNCAYNAQNAEDAWKYTLERPRRDGEIVLEGSRYLEKSVCNDANVQMGVVKIYKISENPNRLVLSIATESAGWLWFADVWYPGWHAWLDREPTQVLRANYLFRAVFVPEGQHDVIIAFRPVVFYLGAGISLLTWLGLVVWLKRCNISKRHR